MASKLFRAVVGFGIGLGAASAACFGATESPGTTTEDGPDASTSTPATNSSTSSSSGDPQPAVDASPDVTGFVDAGLDAPKDVGADAFCDAAWPTTKGNPKPPACTDPNGECTDAGSPNLCVPTDDAGTCNWSSSTTAPFCVNKEWRCQPGTASVETCQ